jgi:hypothetical protein
MWERRPAAVEMPIDDAPNLKKRDRALLLLSPFLTHLSLGNCASLFKTCYACREPEQDPGNKSGGAGRPDRPTRFKTVLNPLIGFDGQSAAPGTKGHPTAPECF